jgi:carbohydrate-binding DOMON domain-containing protein
MQGRRGWYGTLRQKQLLSFWVARVAATITKPSISLQQADAQNSTHMDEYMCTYAHAHAHKPTDSYTDTHTRTLTHTHTHTHIYTHTQTHTNTLTHTYTGTHAHAHIYIYISTYKHTRESADLDFEEVGLVGISDAKHDVVVAHICEL